MTRPSSCEAPLDWDILLAYWLGELDADREAAIEEHYLGCAHCSQRLEWLVALAKGMRQLIRVGGVNMVITEQVVERLREQGMQLREYDVPINGSVNCTVTPEDDLVLSRLEVPLENVSRVDMVYFDLNGKDKVHLEDIPFDASSGRVVFSTRVETLRALPTCSLRVQLLAVDNRGEHLLGEYTFNHTPYKLGELDA